MTLSFCKVFHTIVQQGSFVKTAEILNMTSSAVSHAVKDAEKALTRPTPPAQKKKKNAALLYEQTPISEQDFNNLIVDLNEDV